MSTSLRHIIGATFATQVAAFLITVGGQVLAARWLGPLQFGVMATLLMFADAVNKFTNFGLETSILYFVSNRRYPFRRFIGTNIINGLVLYGVGVLAILSFMYAGGMSLLFRPEEAVLGKAGLWWGTYLLFAAIVHEYGGNIWLGLQQFRRYNGNILTRPVIYVALLLLVYVQGALDVNAALAIYGTSWLLPGLYIWWVSVFPLPLVWDARITRATMGYGIQVMGTNLLVFLVYRSDIFLIAYFLSQEAVGYYYIAVMVAERLLYLTQSSRLVLMPAAAHAPEQQGKVPLLIRANLLAVLLGAALLGAVAPWLIPLVFTSQYQPAVLPLLLLLPGVVAITLPKLLSAALAARGLPRYNLYANAVNFCINLGLNLWLIPRIGIAGAALSSSIAYLVAALMMVAFYRRVSGVALSELLLPKRSDWTGLKKL